VGVEGNSDLGIMRRRRLGRSSSWLRRIVAIEGRSAVVADPPGERLPSMMLIQVSCAIAANEVAQRMMMVSPRWDVSTSPTQRAVTVKKLPCTHSC